MLTQTLVTKPSFSFPNRKIISLILYKNDLSHHHFIHRPLDRRNAEKSVRHPTFYIY